MENQLVNQPMKAPSKGMQYNNIGGKDKARRGNFRDWFLKGKIQGFVMISAGAGSVFDWCFAFLF